ncbi:MAG TPA: hypothetical protein VK254_01715 [Candidatus Bathyarchaeia archaeon]|nr:hypothetical protein [Candidatus Bathyarchaeia archaeon]
MVPLWLAVVSWIIGLATSAAIIVMLLKYPGNNIFTPMIESFFTRMRNKALCAAIEEETKQFGLYSDLFRQKADLYKALTNINEHLIEMGALESLKDMEKERLETMNKIRGEYFELQARMDELEITSEKIERNVA